MSSPRLLEDEIDVIVLPVEMVLDTTENELLGVEIIDLKYQLEQQGAVVSPEFLSSSRDKLHISYDEDQDLFYARIKDGRSLEQSLVVGRVSLYKGILIGLAY